jgi:hypothetical protein
VISKTTSHFWKDFHGLRPEIQKLARERFKLWCEDPFAATFHFKVLFEDVWSVRVNQNYRAVGRRNGPSIVWFWIGTHDEYDQLIMRLS